MSTKFFAVYLAIAAIGIVLVIMFTPAQAATERKPKVDWTSAQPACKHNSRRIWCIKS